MPIVGSTFPPGAKATGRDTFRLTQRSWARTSLSAHRVSGRVRSASAWQRSPTIDLDGNQGNAPDLRDDLAGLRDKALLLTGFAGGLRRSELVAQECLAAGQSLRGDPSFVSLDALRRRQAA
jgi:hypothetical protein